MNVQARVTRRYRFCAAHRLHAQELSDDVNRKVFGKCNNLHGHGHNYTVLVTVKGDIDPQTGEVTDITRLDDLVNTKIVERFDHRHLNHDRAFQDVVTTGENLAKFIWDELVEEIPVGQLAKIGLIETRDNYFEYQSD
ncbi:6-carboxytetrahydropterin synthase [Candidatus Nitronereus thalassa]|uniref:6-carboxy-5,6,7,8-tetrahydropterin synthase n=1 Tax=Candidatus Nitronereus thalassa TaxID=3020898 RepID=A0ABU3K7C9_9BACT|nr:6-carboxytetrahydropterin synthase [Candidatus Nitronereus thalassa]MDT7042233.1 6-carboxytetrahydropterin synthase [Candidatus Nitronereus thalassa]